MENINSLNFATALATKAAKALGYTRAPVRPQPLRPNSAVTSAEASRHHGTSRSQQAPSVSWSEIQRLRDGGDVVPQELVRANFGALRKSAFESLAYVTMRMTNPEAQLWFSSLKSSSSYLEWGTGGSTVLASWRALRNSLPPLKMDAIDSSEGWFERLRSRHTLVRDAEAAGKLTFHLGDIGETVAWGRPSKWGTRHETVRNRQSRSYVESIPASGCCYDLIMVDGRFREACALYALRLMHNESTLIIHDGQRYIGPTNVTSRRRRLLMGDDAHYKGWPVQQYYDVASQADSLRVLRPRPGAIARAKSGNDPAYKSLYAKLLGKVDR